MVILTNSLLDSSIILLSQVPFIFEYFFKFGSPIQFLSGLLALAALRANFAVFSALQSVMPKIEIVGESARDSIMLAAMSTKDEIEVDHIRNMGRVTTSVVGQVADFLTSHKTKNEVLVKADGQPLTIGDVKNKNAD